MMRITTNGTLYTYQQNLYKSTNRLYDSMTKLMTHRQFNSYSANPAAATRAFKIHSSLNATNAQYANNTSVKNKFSTAWDIEDDIIDKLATDLGQVPTLDALNDPNFSTISVDGDILRAGAESIVQSLNSQYDGKFIFNGADTENPPFAIEDDDAGNSYLTFRGVRVADPDPDYYTEEYLDENNQPIPRDPSDPNKGNMTRQEVLDMWQEEALYVDIGIGFKTDDNGNVIESTAFNAALNGLEFLGGQGLDDDGDPQDVVSIMLKLSDTLKQDGLDKAAWDGGVRDEVERLAGKLTKGQEKMSAQHVQLDTKVKFLQTNESQLESTFDSLDTERGSIEDIDEVDAIMALSWAQTSYNAALQVGANVIPQSLMDYLN